MGLEIHKSTVTRKPKKDSKTTIFVTTILVKYLSGTSCSTHLRKVFKDPFLKNVKTLRVEVKVTYLRSNNEVSSSIKKGL